VSTSTSAAKAATTVTSTLRVQTLQGASRVLALLASSAMGEVAVAQLVSESQALGQLQFV
jgi:hypothetical protein